MERGTAIGEAEPNQQKNAQRFCSSRYMHYLCATFAWTYPLCSAQKKDPLMIQTDQ